MSNRLIHFALGSRRRTIVTLNATLLCALICGVIWLVMANATVSRDVHLATSQQPERYTQLYFNNSQLLPTRLTPSKPVQFSYQVVNNEYRPENYTAIVYVVANGQSRVLETDQFGLAPGQAHSQIVNFLVPSNPASYQLIVTLPAQNETIYFRSVS